MNTLLTYDIDKKHAEVKAALIALGYMKSWTSNNTTYYLPNTTLWKKDIVPATAINDLNRVIENLNRPLIGTARIKLERAMAVEFNSWSGIPGEPL